MQTIDGNKGQERAPLGSTPQLRLQHFEHLKPVCPVCLHQQNAAHRLQLVRVIREQDKSVVEGMLHCANPECVREYPIVDGIPLLMPDLRGFVTNNVLPILARDGLSALLDSVLGDCLGSASDFDATRRYLSSYAWDHYGDFDPQELQGEPRPGSVARLIEHGLALLGNTAGPVLDIGCGVGRSAFALAERLPEMVLGVDLHFASLRLANGVLLKGRVRYDRRRIGLVYDRRDFEVQFQGSDRVDFWACDALALPFEPGSFGLVTALNVLDAVTSPRDLLASIRRILKARGRAYFVAPYDWSSTATPPEAWLGGHSQRGEHGGAAEPVLRCLLTPGGHPQAIGGLRIVREAERVDWQIRLHERAIVKYAGHGVVVEAAE